MIIAKVTTEKLTKNPNTKTTYLSESTEEMYLDSDLIESRFVDSMSFFRNLGGSESLQRAYTCNGYSPVKLTSTSPDKEMRTIRTFRYINTSRFYGKRITRFINEKTKMYYGYRTKKGDTIIFDTPKKATKNQMINNY